jgi:hypothetical protein
MQTTWSKIYLDKFAQLQLARKSVSGRWVVHESNSESVSRTVHEIRSTSNRLYSVDKT